MRNAILGLLLALVALAVAAPTSAVAAKKQKAAFTIEVDEAWRYGQDPDTFPIDWRMDFHAWGAISDLGPAWPAGANRLLLQGNKASYLVILTLAPNGSSSTFELYDAATAKLLGTGTVTARWKYDGRWTHLVHGLDGTLVGG